MSINETTTSLCTASVEFTQVLTPWKYSPNPLVVTLSRLKPLKTLFHPFEIWSTTISNRSWENRQQNIIVDRIHHNDILNKTPTTTQQNIDSLIPASPITWQVNTSPFTKPNQQNNTCYEDSIDWVHIHLSQPLKNCFMNDIDLWENHILSMFRG